MKMFLLLLAVCLTASEKLDRTYLPPSGAKLSGGVDGNIEVPFEFPKESYSPTQRPQGTLSNRPVSPEDTRIDVGINRRPGSQIPGINTDSEFSTPGSKAPFDYFQKVPTTTTSYAFTQTTTHPPGDGFDTTLGPFNTATGFPTTTPFPDFSTSVPGFVNFPQVPQGVGQGQQILPGYQRPNVVDQQSGLGLSPGNIQTSGSTLTSTPGPFSQTRPGLSQAGLNQYQIDSNRPNLIPSTSPHRPAFGTQIPNQNLSQYQINQRPGVGNIVQKSTTAPSTPQGIFGYPQYGSDLDGVQVTSTPGSNIYSQSTPGLLPSVSYDGTIQNVPNSNIPSPNLPPRQQLVPQDFVPSGNNVQLGQRPIQNQYQLDEDGKTVTNVPRTQHPSQQQSNIEVSQQFPSQIDQSGRPIPGGDQRFSTVSPNTPVPNYGQFPTTTPGIFPTTYPTGSYQSSPAYPGKSNQVQPGLVSRPERPQAESDRNAVILNYDNVITPDGYFAYSYDTSNGIHADESGTSADGVRANGSYSYIGDDGKVYSIVYTADENGFQPRGDHLPTPPPIPEAIQKVIEQVSRDKEAGISDDGTYDEAKYGHKKFESRRRPLKPNKGNIGDFDIADTDEGQFDEIDNKQQTRPHIGGRKPVSSKGNISNKYDESINVEDQLSEDDLDNQKQEQGFSEIPRRRPVSGLPGQKKDISDRRRPLGEMHSRRPISEHDETGSLSFIEGSESDDESEQGNRLPSKRPGQLPSRIEGKTSSRGNIRPGEKLPSRRPSDQPHYYDTITEDNTFKTENNLPFLKPNKHQPTDESMVRRPIASVPSQYDQEKFDDTNRRVLNKFPSTIPGPKFDITDSSGRPNVHKQSDAEQSLTGTSTDRPKSYDRYNQNRGRPQVTTTFAPQTDDHQVILPGKVSSFAQNVRKPTFGQKPNKINQYTDSISNIDQGPIYASEANASLDQYNGQPISGERPNLNKQIPTRTDEDQETAYIAHDDRKPQADDLRYTGKVTSLDQNVSTPTFTQRPGQINHVPMTGSGTELENGQTLMPGKIYQNIRRPVFGQHLGQQNRPTTVTHIEEETGYEYIPPQRKFDDIPKLRNEEDHDGKYFEHEGNVRKPFVVPGTVDKEEDYEHIEENRKQPRPSLRPGQYTDEPSKYSSIGSTRLPSYQQTQTTARPQDQFEPTRLNYQEGQNIPQGTTRPPHKDTGYFIGKDRDRTGVVPSTTHIPPQDSRFEITQPIHRPGQHITDQFTPGKQYYNIMSTTKMPFQDSSHFEIESSNDNETPSGLHYQTTYKPSVTISSTTENDKFRPDSEIGSTIRPSTQVSNRRPGTYSAGQVPSTTYRPGYFTETIDSKPRPVVDASGRPIVESNVTPGFEGTTIRPGIGSQNIRVPFTDNIGDRQPSVQVSNEDDFISEEVKPGLTKQGRPVIPTDYRGDGTPVFSPYEVSSSTETFIGEDFSGPKQPQRFDPERGYYY